jgi:uncharacterized protein
MIHALILADEETVATAPGEGYAMVVIGCGDVWEKTLIKAAHDYKSKEGHIPPIFAVKGNHDLTGEFDPAIQNLHLAVASSYDLFGGFEGAWKYKAQGPYLYTQEEVAERLRYFPRVDVFVAHNSPRHCHERGDDIHKGFDAFNDYIQRCQPRYFIHGHQHVNSVTRIGDTEVIGVYGKKQLYLEF